MAVTAEDWGGWAAVEIMVVTAAAMVVLEAMAAMTVVAAVVAVTVAEREVCQAMEVVESAPSRCSCGGSCMLWQSSLR